MNNAFSTVIEKCKAALASPDPQNSVKPVLLQACTTRVTPLPCVVRVDSLPYWSAHHA